MSIGQHLLHGLWTTTILAQTCFVAAFADSPVDVLVHEYEEESRQVARAPGFDRLGFYQLWRSRLITAVEAVPNDPSTAAGLVKIVALSNGLSDYATSEQYALRLLAMKESPEWRAEWLGELGEISQARFAQTRDVSDAQRARSFFSEAIEITHNMPDAPRSLQERHVINLAASAQLASVAPTNEAEGDLWMDARQYLTTHGLGTSGRLVGAYDEEAIAQQELLAKARTHPQDAEHLLNDVLSREAQRNPPSFYALQFANRAYGSGEQYQAFLQRWLAVRDTDAASSEVLFVLARDYVRSDNDLAALSLYDRLHKEFWPHLLQLDAAALDAGQGGYTAEILFELGRIWTTLEDYDAALRFLAEFQRLFPHDARRETVAHMISRIVPLVHQRDAVALADVEAGGAGTDRPSPAAVEQSSAAAPAIASSPQATPARNLDESVGTPPSIRGPVIMGVSMLLGVAAVAAWLRSRARSRT